MQISQYRFFSLIQLSPPLAPEQHHEGFFFFSMNVLTQLSFIFRSLSLHLGTNKETMHHLISIYVKFVEWNRQYPFVDEPHWFCPKSFTNNLKQTLKGIVFTVLPLWKCSKTYWQYLSALDMKDTEETWGPFIFFLIYTTVMTVVTSFWVLYGQLLWNILVCNM